MGVPLTLYAIHGSRRSVTTASCSAWYAGWHVYVASSTAAADAHFGARFESTALHHMHVGSTAHSCTRAGEPGSPRSSLGDTKSSLGDAKSSLGDAKSSLGDAKSSLGDAKSSLGDAKELAG
jgi:hypothetical protein